MSIRVVACDLDGTLVRSDGTVSERTRAAISRLEVGGGTFVVVTGRPARWMHDIAEQTGHHGVAVCSNGAVAYDLRTESILATDLLDSAAAAAVVDVLRATIDGIAFAVEQSHGGFGHEPAYTELVRWDTPDKTIAPIEELVAEPVVKLLARHPSVGPADLIAAAQRVIGDRATLTYGGVDGLLEISGLGVTKATGLARYVAGHGLGADDVVAFGDMTNDIPMLEWAGIGIAMANAHPDVVAVADELTDANDDDGVAAWLERNLFSPTHR